MGIGGSYLAQMHTIRHMRDIFLPRLWDTRPYEEWEKKGKKDPMVRAREEAEAVLAGHKPVPLEAAVSQRIAAIARDFLKR